MYDGSINWMPPGMILSRRIWLQVVTYNHVHGGCWWQNILASYLVPSLIIAQSSSDSSAGPSFWFEPFYLEHETVYWIIQIVVEPEPKT